jgi:integrase
LARPKSRAGWRTIPLVDPLRGILARQLELTPTTPETNPHNLVWCMPDGSPIDPRVENEAWHALLKRADVPDARLHDARHTTVDLLLQARVPIEVVQDIVGHSTRAMTMEYRSRGVKPEQVEALRAFAQLVAPTRPL